MKRQGLLEKLAIRSVDSRFMRVIETIRTGWSDYSFIFYIGSVSAILGSLFGLVGWASIIVTVMFFYYVGRFRQHQKREMSKRVQSGL